MNRLLIPDAGPLFSLAAGDLLSVLGHFALVVTDVVKQETFDRGLIGACSAEASRLLSFYQKHAANIQVVKTQVGHLLHLARSADPLYVLPRNMGELSIQSYLIELAMAPSETGSPSPVVQSHRCDGRRIGDRRSLSGWYGENRQL